MRIIIDIRIIIVMMMIIVIMMIIVMMIIIVMMMIIVMAMNQGNPQLVQHLGSVTETHGPEIWTSAVQLWRCHICGISTITSI